MRITLFLFVRHVLRFFLKLIVCLKSVLVTVGIKPKHTNIQSFQVPPLDEYKTLMRGNIDVFSISALYISLFCDKGELIYWENVFSCHQPLPSLRDHCCSPHFLDRTVIIIFMTFNASCLYSTGNVSLVSRLILDAGLTAELVKVWSEQTVWVLECVTLS